MKKVRVPRFVKITSVEPHLATGRRARKDERASAQTVIRE
jgi:hypothetical protein